MTFLRMMSSGNPSPRTNSEPLMPLILTAKMVADAAQVGLRLHTALLKLLDLPAVQNRRAATLAKELGVGRMTCQRITKLGKPTAPSPGAGSLAELPGVHGLKQFLNALRNKSSAEEQLAEAFEATAAFEELLRQLGLSQTSFSAALELYQKANDPDQQLARRTALFEAASGVTGQAADHTISILAFRPSASGAINFEQIAMRGYAGMRASESAMPIRLPINMAYSDFRNVTSEEAARQPQHLVESFSTKPLPSIDQRVIKSEHLAHLVNPEHIPSGESFDCFARQRNLWSVKSVGKHKAIWLYVDYPTKQCTFDVYFHRTIAEQHQASGDCHMWGTSLLAPPEDLWMTRFANQMTFSELGCGIGQDSPTTHKSHKALTQDMFDHEGWEPSEFMGYRCSMAFPIWRSGMCVVLEEFS